MSDEGDGSFGGADSRRLVEVSDEGLLMALADEPPELTDFRHPKWHSGRHQLAAIDAREC